MYRLVALLLCFAMLLPARDIRAQAARLPIGTPVSVRTKTQTLKQAKLQAVTDEGITILVLDGGTLAEKSLPYADIRRLERRAERASSDTILLNIFAALGVIALTSLLIGVAVHH